MLDRILPTLGLVLLLCSSFSSTLVSQETPKKGSRSFDAKHFEARVQKAVEKVRPATVAVSLEGELGMGAATGVIVSSEGHVMTAGHCVMEPGNRFTIILADGTKLPAVGLGLERTLDCGLIKIESEAIKNIQLPFAEMGWSSDLVVGQPCISLGHSGGYTPHRQAVARVGYVAEPMSAQNGFICSTCLMEPGDSGGPLFDLDGKIIGIHSMIEQNLDQNYEVPVDLFRRFWEQLNSEDTFRAYKETESLFGLKFTRGRSQSMTSRSRKNGSDIRGIRVSRVSEQGWASSQGLKKTDRIVKLGDVIVTNSFELEQRLFRHFLRQDSKVTTLINRNGDELNIQLDFTQLEADEIASHPKLQYQERTSDLPSKKMSALSDLADQFKTLESKLDDYCVEIKSQFGKGKRTAFGTLLNSNNETWVVAKSSRIGDSPVVVQDNDREIQIKIEGRIEVHDIVLMRLKEKLEGIPVVENLSEDIPNQMCKMLLSPSPTDKGEVGFLGASEFTTISSGFLGIGPRMKRGKVVLNEIVENSAAEKAGLKKGDIVKSINGTPIQSGFQITALLSSCLPGEEVSIVIRRDSKEIEKQIALGSRSREDMEAMESRMGGHIADSFVGGKSKVRFGFPNVLVHDSRIHPRECGGPVFDISGKFIGINIARRSRTQCYIIPKSILNNEIAKLTKAANRP